MKKRAIHTFVFKKNGPAIIVKVVVHPKFALIGWNIPKVAYDWIADDSRDDYDWDFDQFETDVNQCYGLHLPVKEIWLCGHVMEFDPVL